MSTKRFSGMVAILLFACLGLAEASADVFARENKAEQLYGQGVHAFFDGDYRSAIRMLEQVEKIGSEDPRPYFFLAIAYQRLNQDDKADPMFRKAARMEWESRSFRDFDVSGALRRIQGNERMKVEKYRNEARTDWQKNEKKQQEAKYRKEETKQQDVLAALAHSFVGSAPFGARSLDPFRAEKDDDVKEEKIEFTTAPKKDAETSDEAAPGFARTQPKKTDADMDDNPFDDPPKKDDEKKADADMDDNPFDDPPKKDDEKKADADMDDNPFDDPPKKDDEKKDDAKADDSKDSEDEEANPFE